MIKETFSVKNKYKSSSLIGKITRVGIYHSMRLNTCNNLMFPIFFKSKSNDYSLAEIYHTRLTFMSNNN